MDEIAVQFTDTSTGAIDAWSWDFGDGEFSTEQNPLHFYAEGDYNATLCVHGAFTGAWYCTGLNVSVNAVGDIVLDYV